MIFDETFDFLIVGSGGGAACAALAVQAAGKQAIILEKQDRYGGSTAYSGGVLWLPNNVCLADRDPIERGMLYLDELVGDANRASTHEKRLAYVRNSRPMLEFLQMLGMKFAHAHWPDYYSSEPGGLDEGRSIIAPAFDIHKLGEWGSRLARFEGWPDIPVSSHEFSLLSLAKRTWKGRLAVLRIGWRIAIAKLTGKHLRCSGNSLQGRMLEIALREKVPIRLSSPVTRLLEQDGRVVGVEIEHDGRRSLIGSRDGVLVNAGGFSHNQAMRERYQSKSLDPAWTLANPGDTGEMMRSAMEIGAAVDLMDESWWCPASRNADGSFASFHVPTDAAKPHLIIVDQDGKRIGNEANSYMEFGQRMLAAGAVPAWAIIESRHRSHYPWGSLPPGLTSAATIRSGYLKRAASLDDLARQCGIDPAGLTQTVERFNAFAQRGEDPDFHRGESAYNRYNGDPRHKPNPNLGEISRAPFYACALVPSDVGTAGGLLTDEHARVLRDDGSAIAGLYACGNSAASLFGRFYPGAGASIGHSFAFGWIAARHATGANG